MTTKALAQRIRLHAVQMTSRGSSSHVGSCLSIADLLAVLYSSILQHKATMPLWPERDRFILSKGHASAALYAVLAESGYFDASILLQHCQNGSALCGHVTKGAVPGIDVSTGSLGHGLSIGVGMALSAKRDAKQHRIFVMLSDGECDEGSNWEAIMFAAHHKLDNLVAIVDYNKLQSLGSVSETLNLEPFAEKWRSFGWQVREIDGHDHSEILETLSALPLNSTQPSCIIAHTVKGKGVSFMQNSVLWHYRSPQGQELEEALKELGV